MNIPSFSHGHLPEAGGAIQTDFENQAGGKS